MSLFNRKANDNIAPFNKEGLLKEIIDWCDLQNDNYHVMKAQKGKDYDLIVIKSVSRDVKITINSLNPYTRTEQQVLQQVFLITLAAPHTNVIVNQYLWSTDHLVIDSLKRFVQKIEEY